MARINTTHQLQNIRLVYNAFFHWNVKARQQPQIFVQISSQMFFLHIGTFLEGAPKEIQKFIFFASLYWARKRFYTWDKCVTCRGLLFIESSINICKQPEYNRSLRYFWGHYGLELRSVDAPAAQGPLGRRAAGASTVGDSRP